MIDVLLWGHDGSMRKGMHRLSWKSLIVHKYYGGMRFKDLASFIVAMPGKQG
ncbi:hypothetical protein MTR_7g093920 [Medicago truncatula]|uniref:Uncharacterized protein n=1 Tax=Medicago truncatula TaxID=3880 RepID=G7KWD2_MEDTR|nr:hypothetical protein MTR_7g093920 [Medicago truncatula]